MKRYSEKAKIIFLALIFFGLFGWAESSYALTLPYSTSALTCSDFTQGDHFSGYTGCDGIDVGGDWRCDSSHGMMINSSANYSGGEGGKGFRHWFGPALNQESGSVRVSFSPKPTELWIRYYARWQSGVSWSGLNQKMLYMYLTSNMQALLNTFTSGCLFTAQNSTGNCAPGLTCSCYSPPATPDVYCSSSDWKSSCGGNVLGLSGNYGDDTFHLIEYHFKTSTGGQYDGVFEAWMNNVLVLSKTNINWGGGSVDYIDFPSNNHSLTGLTGCAYYDQDDFAFSTTGRIGPISGGGGGGDTTAPTVPTGLSVS